eukprot:CAMPEP_0167763862 /NCGR_PEP_ID=MMETSP0110_2-20121227/13654_1 /TAXON_ID=629695 /ORGANISM="Gymnochlora sp., Strain CCMP2014" /LENGTH=263 /DNA_ID=CAMNT_0007651085 /DNA_START=38 /DNA_END=829 /DNA_ORIENTATION=-
MDQGSETSKIEKETAATSSGVDDSILPEGEIEAQSLLENVPTYQGKSEQSSFIAIGGTVSNVNGSWLEVEYAPPTQLRTSQKLSRDAFPVIDTDPRSQTSDSSWLAPEIVQIAKDEHKLRKQNIKEDNSVLARGYILDSSELGILAGFFDCYHLSIPKSSSLKDLTSTLEALTTRAWKKRKSNAKDEFRIRGQIYGPILLLGMFSAFSIAIITFLMELMRPKVSSEVEFDRQERIRSDISFIPVQTEPAHARWMAAEHARLNS